MYITDLVEIIEANRAGIYIENLMFDPGVSHKCDGSIHGSIKRFMHFNIPANGIVMFFMNRHAVPNGFVDVTLRPDDYIVHGNMFLSHKSTTFFANSHYVVALPLDQDRVIVHNDLKEKSYVSNQCLFFQQLLIHFG